MADRPPGIRLHKFLAQAGVASLRRSEQLILAGRVAVNGHVVQEMGRLIEPAHDVVAVDGARVGRPARKVYLALHKPAGYLSTARDPQGRATVLNLVHSAQRIYPVGRLDAQSEGLILLTNDGPLAHRLAHPRFEVPKEYRVLVRPGLSQAALERLREGVQLVDGPAKPDLIERLTSEGSAEWLRIVLREGRKREIRRTLRIVGAEVERLVRVRIGPVRLGSLGPGESRPLSPAELRRLEVEV